MGRVDVRRLVFLDESGANLAMGRSHAWVPRGSVLVEPRPRNWGDNLTLVGAMRVDRWVTLATHWGAMNTRRFIEWVQRRRIGKTVRYSIADPTIEALCATVCDSVRLRGQALSA